MRVVTVLSAAGGSTVPFKEDRSTQLVGAVGLTGAALISTDPSATFAAFQTPLSDGIDDNLIWSSFASFPIVFPLAEGQVVYLAFNSGQAAIQLIFDDSPQVG